MLWTVQGRQNTVYLLGSVHVLRPGDAALPRAALDAYADAEQLVMEIDLDDATVGDPLAMAQQMQRPPHCRPGSRCHRCSAATTPRSSGAPARQGSTSRCSTASSRGSWPRCCCSSSWRSAASTRHSASSSSSPDARPPTASRSLGLETPAQQFAVLSGLSLADQKRFLLMTLDESAQADAELEQLLAAWRKGDTSALAALLSDEFERFPQLYRPLTEDRNRAWVGQLDGLLDDRDDYLVVVGALHLVGRDSVVDLLRQRGYTVTQH